MIKGSAGNTIWNPQQYGFIKQDAAAPGHRQPEPVAAVPAHQHQRPVQGRRRHLPGPQPRPVEHDHHRGHGKASPSSTRWSRRRPRRSASISTIANRGQKPVKAVIYTHSHVDHYGGVRGVIERGRRERRQGQDLRARGLPRGGGRRERHGRQRDEPARQLHVRQPAAARPQGPGRRRPRHHHLGRHRDADPADRHHQEDRREADDRRPDLRVPDGARLRGAVRDAVVHRGEEGDRGRRGRDPHAAQHVLAARRQDPRAAAVVEVPQPGADDVGRQGRGDVRPAPLADLRQRRGRRSCSRASATSTATSTTRPCAWPTRA